MNTKIYLNNEIIKKTLRKEKKKPQKIQQIQMYMRTRTQTNQQKEKELRAQKGEGYKKQKKSSIHSCTHPFVMMMIHPFIPHHPPIHLSIYHHCNYNPSSGGGTH